MPLATAAALASIRPGDDAEGVEVAMGERDPPLVCTRWLRVVPGRRLVACAQWGSRDVLAKLFLGRGALRAHRRARDGARLLEVAGVTSPRVLGASAVDGIHVLVFEWLAGASPLVRDSVGAGELARAGRLVAALHAAGLVHTDLHLGNLLDGPRGLSLVDPDAVHRCTDGPLDARSSLANLAAFLATLPPHRTDLVRFALEAYGNARLADRSYTLTALAAPLERARARHVAHAWRKAGRTTTAHIARWIAGRWTLVRRELPSLLDPVLADPDGALERGTRMKTGRSATVAGIHLEGRLCVVKRTNLKGWLHAMRRMLRETRGLRAWRAAKLLEWAGVPTAHALAVVEERRWIFRGRSWLVTERMGGVRGDDAFALATTDEERSRVARAVTELLRRLHAARISHGDLKATNLWLAGDVMSVVDLDGCARIGSEAAFGRRFARDVARLLRNVERDPALRGAIEGALAVAGLA